MGSRRNIAIIDYGGGNLYSVAKAIAKLNYSCLVTAKPQEVLKSEVVILPGVGSARDTMDGLQALNMIDPILEVIAANRPFLGICIGLQILLTSSQENSGGSCLNVVPGVVKRLPSGLKVPHMGWNQVRQRIAHPLFEGIPDESNFYFVHSYYADVEDKSLIAAETDYGITFPSVITKGNLVATQFHLEKSSQIGLKMYDNFLRFALREQ